MVDGQGSEIKPKGRKCRNTAARTRDRSALASCEYYDSMRDEPDRLQRELGFDLIGLQRRCGL